MTTDTPTKFHSSGGTWRRDAYAEAISSVCHRFRVGPGWIFGVIERLARSRGILGQHPEERHAQAHRLCLHRGPRIDRVVGAFRARDGAPMGRFDFALVLSGPKPRRRRHARL